MKRDEILKNKGYWIAKIQIELYNHLNEFMSNNNLNRSQLAKYLGVTKGYISQVLNGDFNHRISKLVELSLAIGKAPKIEFEDLNEYIKDDIEGYVKITWKKTVNSIEPDNDEFFDISTNGISNAHNFKVFNPNKVEGKNRSYA